jgi:hypothetical protein
MKWQNLEITFATEVPKICASGRMKEMTALAGSTDLISFARRRDPLSHHFLDRVMQRAPCADFGACSKLLAPVVTTGCIHRA